MKEQDLSALRELKGFVGACLVDSESGLVLGREGGADINLDVAAAGDTEVVKAKMSTLKALGLKDSIEDMLISLNKQYHLIRMLHSNPTVFLYVMLNRSAANLAMARMGVRDVEKSLQLLRRPFYKPASGGLASAQMVCLKRAKFLKSSSIRIATFRFR